MRRLPIIPLAVFTIMVGAGAYFFFSSSPPVTLELAAPDLNALLDVEGVETEVAAAPGGSRLALVVSGDLWVADLESGTRRRLTGAPETPETAPAWTPDGARITVTRGGDTWIVDPDSGEARLYLEDATDLTHAHDGRIAFVRDRALWVAESGAEPREQSAADGRPSTTIRAPRFSPNAARILFLKSSLELRGEVWAVDLDGGEAYPVIADRISENPASAAWVDNQQFVYLTDRAGGLAVWHVDLDRKTAIPTTAPLMNRALAPIRIDAADGRVFLPRHFIDTDIVDSDGAPIVATERMEFDPAVSANGRRVAWTVINEGRSEVWAADADGANPVYVGLGQHPRLSPNGNEVVYARTDLGGNTDIWKSDIGSGAPTRLTDAPGLDDTPDWSPDGSSILFASDIGGELSLWRMPTTGGRRLPLELPGYAPRLSPDGRRIVYWHDRGVWTAPAGGGPAARIGDAGAPVRAAWGPDGPVWSRNGTPLHEPTPTWSGFDRFPDGRWLTPLLKIDRTEIWTLDLRFAAVNPS